MKNLRPTIETSGISNVSLKNEDPLSIYDFNDIISSKTKSTTINAPRDGDLSLRKQQQQQRQHIFQKWAAGGNAVVVDNDDNGENELSNKPVGHPKKFALDPQCYSDELRAKLLKEQSEKSSILGNDAIYSFDRDSRRSVVINHNGHEITTTTTTNSGSTTIKTRGLLRDLDNNLDALISMIIPKPNYVPTQEFMFCFFLNIRRYVNMHDVLTKIAEKVFVVRNSADVCLTTRTNNAMFIISYWIKTMPYDFRTPLLMNHLKHLMIVCLKYNPNCCFDVRFIIQFSLKTLKNLEIHEKRREANYCQNWNLLGLSIADQCSNPVTLAEQLYILEVEHLHFIGPEEFIQYLNMNKKITGDSKKRTFNIEAYVRWVNRLSYFTTTEIVKQLKRRKRIRVIEYFIDVAEHAIKLRNFNCALAIISGLDDSAVRRLKKTWEKVSVSHYTRFTYYQALLNVSDNFASYRSAIAAAIKETSASECIPFFCVALKDIHYVSEVMPDLLPDGSLNFDKMYKIAAQVAQLNKLSQTVYGLVGRFRKIAHIIELLRTMPIFDGPIAMEGSIKCEKDEKES